MTEKLTVVAQFDIPSNLREWQEIIDYKGDAQPRELIPGVIERVVEIRYSEEVHGKLDAIYANGVRFTPQGWRPIETAPHATDVLVWQKGIVTRARKMGTEWLSYVGSASFRLDPTHWTPLFEAPESQ